MPIDKSASFSQTQAFYANPKSSISNNRKKTEQAYYPFDSAASMTAQGKDSETEMALFFNGHHRLPSENHEYFTNNASRQKRRLSFHSQTFCYGERSDSSTRNLSSTRDYEVKSTYTSEDDIRIALTLKKDFGFIGQGKEEKTTNNIALEAEQTTNHNTLEEMKNFYTGLFLQQKEVSQALENAQAIYGAHNAFDLWERYLPDNLTGERYKIFISNALRHLQPDNPEANKRVKVYAKAIQNYNNYLEKNKNLIDRILILEDLSTREEPSRYMSIEELEQIKTFKNYKVNLKMGLVDLKKNVHPQLT